MTQTESTGRYQIIKYDGAADEHSVIAIVTDQEDARLIANAENARRRTGSSDHYRFRDEPSDKAPYEI